MGIKYREQYIWITFGNDNKKIFSDDKRNGAVICGLGHRYDEEKNSFFTNNVIMSDSTKGSPWTEVFPLNVKTEHHFKMEVSGNEFIAYIDNEKVFNKPLPQDYTGGFIGVGTNFLSTEISNLSLSSENIMFNSEICWFSNLLKGPRVEMPLKSFYFVNDNKLIRNPNGKRTHWMANVPILFFEDKYVNFSLEFDYKYNNLYIPKNEEKIERKVYDPYGKFIFGPPPQEYFVDWFECGRISNIEKTDKYLKINLIDRSIKSLYISLPDCGGVRVSSSEPKTEKEKPVFNTAIFEPKNNVAINLNNDENLLVGVDGTKVKLEQCENFWHLDFYDKNNSLIYSMNNWNLQFAKDRDVCKQFKIEIPLEENEAIFGTGERFSEFNQRGKRIYFWNTDPCYHGPLSRDEADFWRGYKNVPIITSSKGYSVFINTTCCGKADFGYNEKSEMILEFDDYNFDIYFWAGQPIENLIKYTDLTGKQLLPPKWAFQYQAGGSNGFWYPEGRKPEKYLKLLKDMLVGYEKLGTPLAAVYAEGDSGTHSEAYRLAKEYNTRILTWQCQDIDTITCENVFPGIDRKELPLVKSIYNPDGGPYCFVDFTHEDADKAMLDMRKKYIDQGLRGGMCDFAELVPMDALYSNGLKGDRMHNFSSYMYAKAYHDMYKSQVGDDFLCYIRGGCAGSQKWLCTWCGDQYAYFGGLEEQLACGLSCSASGFSIWGGDMACLVGQPTDEVFVRGLQFSTFQPLMRAGGDRTKQPWDYSEKAVEIYIQHFWLRENLLDMIYSYAIRSHITGIPMTKAMALEYPEWKEGLGNGNQYLFGDDILFAPVLQEKVTTKEILFPDGHWYNLFENEILTGGLKIVNAPYEYSPAYIRSGSVIPVKLNSNAEFFKSFTENDMISALLITPPDVCRKTKFYVNKDSFVDFVNKPINPKEFSVMINGDINSSFAVIYSKVSRIIVNGENLTPVKNKDEVIKYGGYAYENGKTYVKSLNNNFKQMKIYI